MPLDDTCTIVSGAPTTVMAGMAEVVGTAEREAGTDYSSKNFGGARCGPDIIGHTRTKWMNMTGSMCLIDWGFMSMTSGNPLVLNAGGDTIGYQELLSGAVDPCTDSAVPKVALAIIRKAATGDGGCNATTTSGSTTNVLHVFPNTTEWYWAHPGFKDERDVRTFEAKGYGNPNIGAGPWNLWPSTALPNTIDAASAHSEVFIDSTGIPTPDCNPQNHPTPR